MVLEHDVRHARLELALEDVLPQRQGGQLAHVLALLHVRVVHGRERLAVGVLQPWARVRRHEVPVRLVHDAAHELVGDVERQEQVAAPLRLRADVAAQLDELPHVGVPAHDLPFAALTPIRVSTEGAEQRAERAGDLPDQATTHHGSR